MLGSVSEAEDMVQETFMRWQRQSAAEIKSVRGWLTSAITRLCIDQLRSARRQREEYVGVWLPEPLVANHANAEDKASALADSLSMAFLVMLETLSPPERAVFLLREVFEYDFGEIGRIVDKSEDNCRQMLRRAREHVAAGRSRFEPAPEQNEQLVQRFLRACRGGEIQELLSLLTDDIVLYSDGGGKVPAAPQPVEGRERVARFLVGVSKISPAGVEVRFAVVNAAPGILVFRDRKLVQTTTFDIANGRVRALYIVRNPDKLKHLAAALPVEGGAV
jgi:RNA polymerase sigma-70 factor (ECF subfamily)